MSIGSRASAADIRPGVDAIIGNCAIAAGLDPGHDSFIVESAGPALIRRYCCLVVVRQGDEAKPWAKLRAATYKDPALQAWVEATCKGTVIPGA